MPLKHVMILISAIALKETSTRIESVSVLKHREALSWGSLPHVSGRKKVKPKGLLPLMA